MKKEVNKVEKGLAEYKKEVAKRNKTQVLYCTECCTHFKLDADGNWVSGSEVKKVADVIQDRLIVCTCGAAVGVIAKQEIMIGEVVPMR